MISKQNLYSVGEITEILRGVITSEPVLQDCWVEGEISNFARPSSGHIYFTLKDESSQIRCAVFRPAVARLSFAPKNGDAVLVHGRLSIYQARSEYQIVGDWMEPAGVGRLHLAFERLKEKLAAEGLFDLRHKKRLPEFPQKIGVITSATGAVVRDIFRMLQERYPVVEATLCATIVQGEDAAIEIAHAIECMNRLPDIDLLIVGRGGGSIEDLWAFNEEIVARAIFASHIPIVSAIGHETDFTIADFVADLRAPTPSAAVELVVPDRQELQRQVADFELRLERCVMGQIDVGRTKLTGTENRIVPGRHIDAMNRFHQTIDRLETQILQEIKQRLAEEGGQLDCLAKPLKQRVTQHINAGVGGWRTTSVRLNALNPIATLARGYSVCQNPKGEVVTDASLIEDGEVLDVQLSRGALTCKVVKKKTENALVK